MLRVTTRIRGPRSRDRETTRKRILDAVGRILSRRGFAGLGINAVAVEASVDKVLIYRYFGGLPELLAVFARQEEFWPHEDELLRNAPTDAFSNAATVLKALMRALRSRPMTQEVLRWELSASNQLVGKLAAVREEHGLRTLGRMAIGGQRLGGVDVPAIAALLSAGITYLVLRSKSREAWLGVSLQSAGGWKRIEKAIDHVVSRVLDTGAGVAGGETDETLAHRSRVKPRRRRSRPRGRSIPIVRR